MDKTTIHISKVIADKIKKLAVSEKRHTSQQAEFMLNKQLERDGTK